MTFSVQVARRAESDMAAVFRYIGDHLSSARATRWRTRLVRKIESLADDPYRYPIADDASAAVPDLRQMLFDRAPHVYRVLYRIEGPYIVVVRIRHASQDSLTTDDL